MRMTRVDAGIGACFLLVAFGAAGLLGAVQPATGVPAEVVQLTQFGPALGVAVAALLWPRRVRSLLAGGSRDRLPGGGRARRDGMLLLCTAPLVVAASAGAYAVLGGEAGPVRPGSAFALIAAAQLVGACGEEIGWRCLLQPLLRGRFGTLTASVLVGAVWGVWHVQVFARHPVYAGAFLLAAVAMSAVMGWALEGSGGAPRLLLAGGFHALVNLGMLLLMDEEDGAVLPMALFGASCLAAAVVWTACCAGRRSGPPAATPAAGSGPGAATLPVITHDVR
ncbi:lysostaphin resistance A-like protein [Streptomyces globosus]|uniref:CPBP family intramembrane glutamic endopeptidase n=1 Tax=Streptomyces globosus TaxID=68209 RepID=UPI00382D7C0D